MSTAAGLNAHICGGGRTSAECPECVWEDQAAHESARVLGLEFEIARSMPDECQCCSTMNWPDVLIYQGETDDMHAYYTCRRCGLVYRCNWSRSWILHGEVQQPPEPSQRPTKQAIARWLVKQVMERDAYRCQQPGCGTWIDLTVDHVYPESLGGPTVLENLQTLCRPHNSSKGARTER